MKKISKEILLEIIPIFLVTNIFFIFIMLMEQMVQLAELLFIHSVPISITAKIFICYMPSFLMITIPVSTLISVLLAFSRFSADSELIAMYACGAGKQDLIKPVAFFGAAVTAFAICVSVVLLPKGSSIALANINLLLQNLSINDIQEKEMYSDLDGIIFYADKKIDKANFEDTVFIYTERNAVITAQKSVIVPNKNKSVMIEFENGKFAFSENNNNDYTVMEFSKMLVNYPLNITIDSIPENEKLMTLKALKQHFTEDPVYKFEYHKRLSVPLSNLLMALCGFFMGIFFQRTGRSLGLTAACATAVIYNALMFTGANFINIASPALLAWMPNTVLLLLLSVLIYRSN